MSRVNRTLSGLTPSSRYVARVRAVSKLGQYSTWSEAVDFETPGDTSVPNPPADLVDDFSSPELILSWTPPSLNTDGTQIRDFKCYQVILTANSISREYTTVQPTFFYSIQQNRTDFGTAQPVISVEVRTVDVTDKVSAPLTGQAVNPAPLKPLDITGSAVLRNVALNFQPHPNDRDITEYLVERSTNGTIFTLVQTTTGDAFIDNVDQGDQTYFYRYQTQDVFGQVSPYSEVFQVLTEEPFQIDLTPPDVVSGFVLDAQGVDPLTGRAHLDLSWSPTNDVDDLSHYEIRMVRVSDSFVFSYQVSPYASTYHLGNLDTETQYQLVMYAFDYSGNRSSPTSPAITVTTGADDSAPAAPVNYAAVGGVELIIVSWDPVDHIQLSHYEVYAGTTTAFTPDTTTFTNRVFYGNASRFTQETSGAETRYFRVRAVNTNGQVSPFTPEFSGSSRVGFVRDTAAPVAPTLVTPLTSSLDTESKSTAYLDVDWSMTPVPADLAGFKVQYRRYTNATTPLEITYTSVDVPKSEFDTRIRGLIPGVWYGVRVQAYDDSLNYSPFSSEAVVQTAVNTVPPDAPTFATPPEVYVNLKSIWWIWNGINQTIERNKDLKHYEAQISTSSTFTTIAYIYRGLDTSAIYQAESAGQTYHLRVRAVNNSDVASAWSQTVTAVTANVDDEDLTNNIPPVPTGLSAVTGVESSGATDTAFIILTWNTVAFPTLAGYSVRIRRGTEGSHQYVNVPAGQTSVKFSSLIPNVEYRVDVAAFSRLGYQSAYSAETVLLTARDSVAPAVPTQLDSYATLRSLSFIWNPVTAVDLSHYQAQVSPNASFTGTPFVFEGLATSVSYVAPALGTYYFRVRAVDGSGNASAWSAVISETATEIEGIDIDTDPPAVPSGLSLSSGIELQGKVETFSISANWNTNTDNDLAGYIVRLRRSGDLSHEYRNIPPPDTSTKFSGLLAGTTYLLSILAYDSFGNHSAYSTEVSHTTVGDTTPPPVPANPQGRGSLRSLIWSWDAVSVADLDHYEAQIDTVNTFASPDYTFEGLATGFTYITPALTTYYMRVRAVDVSGNMSAWSTIVSASAAEIEGLDLDTDPPAIPTGLALTTGQEFNGQVENVYLNASWNANGESDFAGYTVRLRRGSESRYEYRDIPKGQTSVKFPGLQGNTEYRVQISGYDQLGNRSLFSGEVSQVTTRDTTPPAVPASPAGAVTLKTVSWSWDSVSDVDFSHYVAEVSLSNIFATIAEEFVGRANGFSFVGDPTSTYYLRVRSVDVSGNMSAWTSTISAVTANVQSSDVDTTPPIVPTGLALTTGQEFNGQVENVFINATWTAVVVADLAGYSVRLRRGAETRYEYRDVPKGNVATKFAGLQPGVSYGVQVAAYDGFGNISAYSTEVTITSSKDLTAPAVPVNFASQVSLKTIQWRWDRVVDLDLAYYEAEVSTVNTFASVLYNYRGLSPTFAYAASTVGTTLHARVRSVDVSGNISAWSATNTAVTTSVVPTDVDTTAPTAPTGLALTTGQEFNGQLENVFIDATWSATGMPTDLAGYKVRLRRGTESRYEYQDVPKGNVTAKFTGLQANTSYRAQVAAYDTFGNISAFSTEVIITTARDLTAPPVPAVPTATVTLRTINWTWAEVAAVDLAYYEAQVDDATDFVTPVYNFKGRSTGFSFLGNASNKSYYVRVRSVDTSGNISAWSAVTPAAVTANVESTDIDSTAPTTPTGLAATTGQEFSGQVENIFLVATWSATGMPADLAGYSVRMRRGAESNYEYRDVVKGNTSAKFVGLEPGASYNVQIAAYDGFGNVSAYSSPGVTVVSAKDLVAPDVPQTPTGSVNLRTINWSWSKVAAPDLSYYQAQVSTSNTFTSVAYTYEGLSSAFSFVGSGVNISYYMRVRAYDVSGNVSGWSTVVGPTTTQAVTTTEVDTTPPATPATPALTTGQEALGQVENVYVNASWVASGEADLGGYTVRIRKGAESLYEYQDVPASSTSVKFSGLKANTSYGVQVAAFDRFGNYSGYTTEVTILTTKDAVAPANVANLMLTAGIRSLIVQWDAVTAEDLKHYNVDIAVDNTGLPGTFYNFSKVIATAEQVGKYHNGTSWVDLVPGSTYHVRVRPEDVSGNIPGSPPSTSAVVGQTRGTDIGDATIGNAKISDLAVDKITAGTLSAVITTSGTIRTAASGARVELNNAGMVGYATDGVTKNLEFKNSDGSLSLKGAIQSGSTITGTNFSIPSSTGEITLGASPLSTGIILRGDTGFTARQSGVVNTSIGLDGVAIFNKVSIQGTAAASASGGINMSVTSGLNSMRVDTSGLYLGPTSTAFASAPFTVAYDGSVKASKLTIFGTSSEIANAGSLTLNGDIRLLTTTGRIYLGATTGSRVEASSTGIRAYSGATETFNLNATTGGITLTGPAVVGGSITGASIKVGTDPNSFNVNSTGDLWLGASTYAAAPFQVYRDGTALATKLKITGQGFALATDRVIDTPAFWVTKAGEVVATSGTIGNVTITSTKLTGGVIEGSTIQGANFKVDNAGGIQFRGSGTITWDTLATGGIQVANNGYVRSGNFASGSTGWNLGATGLEINQGTIRAAALQIGVSNTNLLRNASFEDYSGTSPVNWLVSSGTTTNSSGTSLYQARSLILGRSTTGNAETLQTVSFPQAIPVGTDITISAWARKNAGLNRTMQVLLTDTTGATIYGQTTATTISSNSLWTRLSLSFRTTTALTVMTFRIRANSLDTTDTFLVDGAQLQFSGFATDFAPAPLDIPNNYINSAHISGLTVDRLIGGTVGAQTIVLNGVNSIIQSSGYGTSGWQIKGDGTARFQNGSVTIFGASSNLVLDSASLRLTTGTGTAMNVNSTGFYLGGSSAGTASFYNEGTKTVFQSAGTGYKLQIDSSAPVSGDYTGVVGANVAKIMSLYTGAEPGSTDNFYLTAGGGAYFRDGVISDTTIQYGTILAGRMVLGGTPATAILNAIDDAIISDDYVANASGFALRGTGSAEFNDVIIRGRVEGSEIVGGSIAMTGSSAPPHPVDFNAYTTGEIPPGWVFLGGTGWTVAGVSPTKYLSRPANTTHAEAAVHTGLPSDYVSNSDVRIKFRITGTKGTGQFVAIIGVRGDYSTLASKSTLTGCFISYDAVGQRASIAEWINGVQTTSQVVYATNSTLGTSGFVTGVWFHLRMLSIDNTIKVKIWEDGFAEPESWASDVVTRLTGEMFSIVDNVSASTPLGIDIQSILVSGSVGNFYVTNTGRMWIGSDTYGTATTRVESDGSMSMLLAEGSESKPSIRFSPNGSSGIFARFGNHVAISSYGTMLVDFSNVRTTFYDEVMFQAGAANDLKLTVGNQNTGIYGGSGRLGFAVSGDDIAGIDSAGLYTSTGALHFTGSGNLAPNKDAIEFNEGLNYYDFYADNDLLMRLGDTIELFGETGHHNGDSTLNATGTSIRHGHVLLARTGPMIYLNNTSSSNARAIHYEYRGALAGYVNINATSTVSYFNTGSDYRLKQDVRPLGGSLAMIKALRPVTFRWKQDPSLGRSAGFIAHELQELFPDAVSGEKDGKDMQWVDFTKMIPRMAAAIKELAEEVEELRSLVTTQA